MKSANFTTCRLGEVCAIEGTLVDPRDPRYRTLPHVGGANMVSGGGLTEVRAAGDDELISGKYLFSEEDVLYSKIRPYLKKVATPSFGGLCSADVYPLRPDKTRIERAYLLYLLLSPDFTDYAIRCSNRAGMPKVNREQLFSYSFKLPPLEEQRRVVARVREALVRVDEIVTLRKNALGESRAMPAAAIQDEWNAVTLCNATQKPLKELGKVTTGSTPSTAQIKFYGGSIPWITPGDITARRVISGARKHLTAAAVRDGGARVVTAGSVAVVCIGATIGKVGQCLADTGINQQINAVSFGDQVDPAFGYWACRQLYSSIVTNAKQATLPILNKSSFESLPIPVPPLPTQRAIAERLNRVHDGGLSMVDEQEDGLIACAALKQSILRKAFAGEL